MTQLIDPTEYTTVVKRLRSFFDSKKFLEVHTQNRLSILAACEDPTTVATYEYGGKIWPLPQTGQMWLEYELLTKPDLPDDPALRQIEEALDEWLKKHLIIE